MPRTSESAEIINRNAPILIINETKNEFNRYIQTELRRSGLISKVSDLIDLPSARISTRYALVVSVVDTASDVPFITETRSRAGTPQRRLVIDLGQSYSANHWVGNGVDFIECEDSADSVTEVISHYFRDRVDLDFFDGRKSNEDYGPKLNDLIQRLEIATDTISDLRVNSASEAIAELRDVVATLKIRFVQGRTSTQTSKEELRRVIYEVLYVISKIYDHVDNSRLASIIVSGVTTAIMGCSGLSAALSVTIMLASWHGKDAFIAAVNKINPGKVANS